MKKIIILIVLFVVVGSIVAQAPDPEIPEYQQIKDRLISGWNTWNTRSVTQYVLLPEGFSINLAFKQHYWLEEQYLREALIGRYGEYAEKVRPGPHSWNGSYTQLELKWEELHARIETAHVGEDLVLLVTPLTESPNKVAMVVEAGMLWNRPGSISKTGDILTARLDDRTVSVYATASHEDDFYVQVNSPYLNIYLDQPVGLSTGQARTIEEIQEIIKSSKQALESQASKFGELAEAYLAIQAGIAWNMIYEPQYDRVVSTVGRLWNEEYGGYCLFGWDNFFMAYITALDNRELAYANIIEHLRGATEEGFIPNDNRGNGSKSFDRSQPPVGSIMVKEIYRRYPEEWFLETVFDPLLKWNRWWVKKRLNEGLLGYGSHAAMNPFNEPATQTKRTAGYESGMDDSPMYTDVPFNPEKNTMELQDVGLISLYIADCKALAEMARILNRTEETAELETRADDMSKRMEALWDDEVGFYLNKRTDLGELSSKLSPTLFYPMLAEVASPERAARMVAEHFNNPEEFSGEWMLPSIARNDSVFERQRYWKGAIWPPLNFLTYLSLRKAGQMEAASELAGKSLRLLMDEWERKGYVSENYSSITGTGDDQRLSSDKFHSWGTLFGIISFIEKGHLPATETAIE